MPQPKVNDAQLLDRLAEVFRQYGFEGASLTRLTEATGLQRASLYHRFPQGKEQMAAAVIDRINGQFADHVLKPLFEDGDLLQRVTQTAERLSEFYAAGAKSCVVDTLSLGQHQTPLQLEVAQSCQALLGALEQVALEAGATPTDARLRAQQAAVDIQGGLVLARATGDRTAFQRALRQLPETLGATR